MEGPRPPSEGEYPEVLEFLKKELRPDFAWSLEAEYPTALTPTNIHNIRIIKSTETVVSHAVLKPLVIRTPLAVFKVAGIGSVVTHSEHRNQGHSQKILEACLLEAQKQECDLAILWTNLYDYYRRFQFELAGSEIALVIQEEFQTDNKGLRFHTGHQVSAEAILKLFNQHTVISARTAEDVRKCLQIPQTTCYTAWDQQNQLVAFAIEGKGADLTGYIHEWGGSVSKLLSLLSYIRAQKKSPITVISPEHSQNFVGQLSKVPGVQTVPGFLGMLKIVNEAAFFGKVKKAARSLGIGDIVLERQGTEVILGTTQDQISIGDEKDLIKILFGPAVEIPYLQDATKQKLNRFLPLPLWIWGWDSI